VALALVVVHLVWPALKVDAITITLLILAGVPWLAPLVSSAKFPGGWEITFRDVADAGAKIDGAQPIEGMTTASPGQLELAPDQDANLALVRVRIELERRLRDLAGQHGVLKLRSLHKLVRDLSSKGVLSPAAASGLAELIYAGNRAAHGAAIEPAVADWARDFAPGVLAELDGLLESSPTENPAHQTS
jgi:hypothetical protein